MQKHDWMILSQVHLDRGRGNKAGQKQGSERKICNFRKEEFFYAIFSLFPHQSPSQTHHPPLHRHIESTRNFNRDL